MSPRTIPRRGSKPQNRGTPLGQKRPGNRLPPSGRRSRARWRPDLVPPRRPGETNPRTAAEEAPNLPDIRKSQSPPAVAVAPTNPGGRIPGAGAGPHLIVTNVSVANIPIFEYICEYSLRIIFICVFTVNKTMNIIHICICSRLGL